MVKQSALMQVNRIAAKMRQEYEIKREHDFHFARQLFADLSQIALDEAFSMSADDIERFINALAPLHDEFCDLWNADTDDVEYTLAKLDERLKTICGDRFIPADERYSQIIIRGKEKTNGV